VQNARRRSSRKLIRQPQNQLGKQVKDQHSGLYVNVNLLHIQHTRQNYLTHLLLELLGGLIDDGENLDREQAHRDYYAYVLLHAVCVAHVQHACDNTVSSGCTTMVCTI